MKRLMELCLSPDLGGLELYMVRAAKALDDVFDVVSVINPNGKLVQYFEGTAYRFETIEKKNTLIMFKAAKKLSRLIDEHKIDIVHLHWTKDIPIAVAAKLLSKRKPKLVQTRNMNMTKFKNDPYHRFLYRHIDMMLPVTKRVADQLNRFIPEDVQPRIEVLYMGSDRPKLLNSDEKRELAESLDMRETFAVGMVGRIHENKGQYLLIDAITSLRSQGLDVQAFFVGHEMKNGYIDSLKNQAHASGVADAVHFLGFMKNPHGFFQVCDAVVLATPCETFGLVIIEAMQAGAPVVATNACGPLEIIEDGRSGMLFEAGSSESLARAIKKLSADPSFCKRIAQEGQAQAEKRFSNEKQFAELGRLLAEV